MKATVVKIEPSDSRKIRMPKELFELIKLSGAARLRLSADGDSISITPAKPAPKSKLKINDEYLISIPALAKDWDTEAEDKAWAYLQTKP